MNDGPARESRAHTPRIDVSVIIPVRNGSATVRRAVKSALLQDGVSVEVIAVDDGSTDGTHEVLRALDDPRLVVVRQENRGVSCARNGGAEQSSGEVLVFLDADDRLLQGALEEHRRLARQHGLSCSAVQWIEEGASVTRCPSSEGPLWLAGAYAVTRSLFVQVGGFDEVLRFSENFELSIRLLEANDGRYGESDHVVVAMERSQSGSLAQHRLEAVEHILAVHTEGFLVDGRLRSRWHGIAAVEGVRHRRPKVALRHAVASAVASPTRGRAWLRLLSVLAWPLATHRHPTYRRNRSVVHILPRDMARGAQRHARMLCDGLHDGRRHLIAVLYGVDQGVARPDVELSPGVQGKPSVLDAVRTAFRLRALLREQRPDFVVAHGSEPLRYLVLAAPGTVVVYHRIGTSSQLLDRWGRRSFHRWLVGRARAVVAVSHDVASESTAKLGVHADRLTVVPNGRDASVFRPAEVGLRSLPVIGWVGHMASSKRPGLFLDVVGPITASGRSFGSMVGDGPELADVRSRARSWGIDVQGRSDDVAAVLRGMDVFVFTSSPEGEGLPGVLIEAALSALPIVATDVPGVRDVVLDGQSGFVVACEDADGLRSAVELLIDDPSLRARMGDAARRHAEASLSLEASVAGWSRVIGGLGSPGPV